MATKATTEAHGGAHGAKAPFPPFNSETFASQLIWFAIAFILLYVLMSRVALPRVGAIVEGRANKIADDLAAAQKLKDETDTALAELRKDAGRCAQQCPDDCRPDARQADGGSG